jgi:hypothetical protein
MTLALTQNTGGALRKILKTKLKRGLKSLVKDCLPAFDSGFWPCSGLCGAIKTFERGEADETLRQQVSPEPPPHPHLPR